MYTCTRYKIQSHSSVTGVCTVGPYKTTKQLRPVSTCGAARLKTARRGRLGCTVFIWAARHDAALGGCYFQIEIQGHFICSLTSTRTTRMSSTVNLALLDLLSTWNLAHYRTYVFFGAPRMPVHVFRQSSQCMYSDRADDQGRTRRAIFKRRVNDVNDVTTGSSQQIRRSFQRRGAKKYCRSDRGRRDLPAASSRAA